MGAIHCLLTKHAVPPISATLTGLGRHADCIVATEPRVCPPPRSPPPPRSCWQGESPRFLRGIFVRSAGHCHRHNSDVQPYRIVHENALSLTPIFISMRECRICFAHAEVHFCSPGPASSLDNSANCSFDVHNDSCPRTGGKAPHPRSFGLSLFFFIGVLHFT